MQSSTLIVLACVLAVVMAAQQHHYPEVEDVYQSEYNTPVHDNSPRTKRGLLLLKKKLLLGALGLKAAKVGAVGVAGALALKSKGGHQKTHEIKIHSHDAHHGSVAHLHDHHQIHQSPHSYVEVHDKKHGEA